MDPKTNTLADHPVTKEVVKMEQAINSNAFNGFELHAVSKNNSLYFMLQYVYQRYNFMDTLKVNSHKSTHICLSKTHIDILA